MQFAFSRATTLPGTFDSHPSRFTTSQRTSPRSYRDWTTSKPSATNSVRLTNRADLQNFVKPPIDTSYHEGGGQSRSDSVRKVRLTSQFLFRVNGTPSHSVSLESSTGKASAGIINDVGGENFISNGSLFFCRFEYYKYLNCTKIIIEIN